MLDKQQWKEIFLSTSSLKTVKKQNQSLSRNQKRLFEGCRKNKCFQVPELN